MSNGLVGNIWNPPKEPYLHREEPRFGDYRDVDAASFASLGGWELKTSGASKVRASKSHAVTTYNVETHIINVQLEHIRLSLDIHTVPEGERVSRREVLSSMGSNLDDLRARWVESVQSALYSHETRYRYKSAGERRLPAATREQRFITTLIEDLEHAKSFIGPYATEETRPRSVAELPKFRHYYTDLNDLDRMKLWGDRMSNEIVANVWKPLKNHIAIEANLDAPVIGLLMQQTFCIIADATWDMMVVPRLELKSLTANNSQKVTHSMNLLKSDGVRNHVTEEN